MPEPKEWKIKTNEDGAPIIEGMKITFVAPDGKELPLDPPQMYQKIIDLGKEAKGHREAAETAQAVVNLFDGIEDIAEWKANAEKALTDVGNFNDKDWMKVDKVDTLKKEMSDSYEAKLTNQKTSFETALGEKDKVISQKDAQINKLLISNNFAVHPLFGGPEPKTKLTPEMAEAYFAPHFRVETQPDGINLVLRAYNDPGKFEDPVYSRENPGEAADFAEAMMELWDKYPGRDSLMAAGAAGSGSGGGGGEEDADPDSIASLEKQYAAAKEARDTVKMTALKNRIFRLKQKRGNAA